MQYVIQIKNGIIKHANVNVKIIVRAEKIIVWILTHVFVRKVSISKYFSDWVWWDYNSYGYCISKKDYSNKCYEYCFNKLP